MNDSKDMVAMIFRLHLLHLIFYSFFHWNPASYVKFCSSEETKRLVTNWDKLSCCKHNQGKVNVPNTETQLAPPPRGDPLGQ